MKIIPVVVVKVAKKGQTMAAKLKSGAVAIADDGTPHGVQRARNQARPVIGNALSIVNFSQVWLGDGADMGDMLTGLNELVLGMRDGDKKHISDLYASQMLALNAVSTALLQKAAGNMGKHMGATETYLRLALKAQSQSRQTAEALAKLHQPREQVVRHIHVNEGGQAIVADQFHNHAGGSGNGFIEQPRATALPCASPSVPCSDPLGEAVSVASREGERAL